MHIGIITASMPPYHCGIGDHSLQLTSTLRQLGHEVSIIAGRGEAGDGVSIVDCDWGVRSLERLFGKLAELQPDLVLTQFTPLMYRSTNHPDVSASTIEVPVVRLDEELKDSVIEVLKIDVEGADTWVLYGCEKLLKKRQIRRIFFEDNPSRMAELGIGANEAREFLESVGYACRPFGSGSHEWEAYPIHPPLNTRDQSAP